MLCCKIVRSQNNLKLKVRTEFPNVWGEYKYHSNPYIQGTTYPVIFRCSISIFIPFSTFQVHVPWPWLSPRVHALYVRPLQCVRVAREPWNGAISLSRKCLNAHAQTWMTRALFSPAFYPSSFSRDELIV